VYESKAIQGALIHKNNFAGRNTDGALLVAAELNGQRIALEAVGRHAAHQLSAVRAMQSMSGPAGESKGINLPF
jgi:hypothetical protein